MSFELCTILVKEYRRIDYLFKLKKGMWMGFALLTFNQKKEGFVILSYGYRSQKEKEKEKEYIVDERVGFNQVYVRRKEENLSGVNELTFMFDVPAKDAMSVWDEVKGKISFE